MCRGQKGAKGCDDLLELFLVASKEVVKDLLLSRDPLIFDIVVQALAAGVIVLVRTEREVSILLAGSQ